MRLVPFQDDSGLMEFATTTRFAARAVIRRVGSDGAMRLNWAALVLWLTFLGLFGPWASAPLVAQQDQGVASEAAEPTDETRRTNRIRAGYLIDVPLPIDSSVAAGLIRQLESLAESGPANQRVTAVMRYDAVDAEGQIAETSFEDALKLARVITSSKLGRVRVVSFVRGAVEGHAVLPILASESLVVSRDGVIADASAAEAASPKPDPTILLSYQAIAEQRGLFPQAIVAALVDRNLELARVSKLGGEQVFAAGEQLESLRQSGQLLGETVWSAPGVPLRINAKQLRTAQIASAVADSLEQVTEALDLAEVNPVTSSVFAGKAKGVMLEITGAIASGRVRRWQSNLSSTLETGEINTWVIAIDSGGGSLDESATLAGWFAQPEPPLQTVAGVVRGEARGDSALIALACKPLFLLPDARIGGPGAESISEASLRRYDELIDVIANSTRRPAALIRGLLDPNQIVYRYTNRKTGRVRYATEQDLTRGVEDPAAEMEKWVRGESIELRDGLSSAEAVALGLAEGESRSLEDASRRVGLPGTPPQVSDRGIVRLVERVGRSNTLAFLLLFIGFAALSAEANAPGLGFPGFVALICFAMYFWMKFLAGTAEWLELVAFTLGIACIAIEVFLVPGFGVFGVGGLALTVLGVVLMSQTFVVPRNVYQIEVLSRGIWVALGGAAGLIGGFIAMRMMLPHVPMLRGLVMEPVDQVMLEESEKLGDFSYLFGQTGTATTPLHPSGKARFGDQVIQVISDGTAIAVGERVRVREVHATKVVVEPLEAE
jgi:membrane-bound ClpP family serine protease